MMGVKTKQIISTILLLIPALVLVAGGVMKITGTEPETVVQFLTRAGFGEHFILLGIMELAIAALLLYPATNKAGFLLACSYFGGAFCLELGGAQPPVSAIFLALLWTAMFIRKKEMFLAISA